jgi:hypothetical protein
MEIVTMADRLFRLYLLQTLSGLLDVQVWYSSGSFNFSLNLFSEQDANFVVNNPQLILHVK